jgi:hypothetical protein
VLHVISNPFPQVWHTLGVSRRMASHLTSTDEGQDDASVLSMPAMNRWNRILRVFTAEYLGLVLDGVAPSPRTTDELVSQSSSLCSKTFTDRNSSKSTAG